MCAMEDKETLYAFCGQTSLRPTDLQSSIERLYYAGMPSEKLLYSWYFVAIKGNDILTPRKSSAISPLNSEEIMIMGGKSPDGPVLGSAIVFNTKYSTCRKVCNSRGKFESLSN